MSINTSGTQDTLKKLLFIAGSCSLGVEMGPDTFVQRGCVVSVCLLVFPLPGILPLEAFSLVI